MNKAPDKQRKALGKGLSALLPTRTTLPRQPGETASTAGTRVGNIPILQIEPNPLQPRKLRGPQPPFAGNQFKVIALAANNERLYYSVCLY